MRRRATASKDGRAPEPPRRSKRAQAHTLPWWDLLVLAAACAHCVANPFSKVEESFNTQAAHDALLVADVDGWDHHTYSGTVPRTFLGALAIAAAHGVVAAIATPLARWKPREAAALLRWLAGSAAPAPRAPRLAGQVLCRLWLAAAREPTVDILRRRVAATPRPRRGCSMETSRGDAAAATFGRDRLGTRTSPKFREHVQEHARSTRHTKRRRRDVWCPPRLAVAFWLGFRRFARGAARAFGPETRTWLCVLTAAQFHACFYASRLLPNSIAMPPVLWAYGLALEGRRGAALAVLGAVVGAVRCDVAAVAIPLGLAWCFLGTDRCSLVRVAAPRAVRAETCPSSRRIPTLCHVDIPWRRVAATPRALRGYSVGRGDAAGATWRRRGCRVSLRVRSRPQVHGARRRPGDRALGRRGLAALGEAGRGPDVALARGRGRAVQQSRREPEQRVGRHAAPLVPPPSGIRREETRFR